MLMPKFSLRWLLLLTAVCAGLSLIIAAAVKGHAWALAISFGFAAAWLTLAVHWIFFGLSWLIAVLAIRGRRPPQAPATPDQPPPPSTD